MRIGLIPVISLILVACAVPGDPESLPLGYKIPDGWTAGKVPEGQVPSAWCGQFDDQVLADLVEEALRNNQNIRQAAARIASAEAMARIAGADLYPHVTGGLSAARGRNVILDQSIRRDQYGVSLDLSWELDLWGRIRAGRIAALKDLKVARAEYSAARLSIVGQTAKAWFAVTELQRQVELSRRTVTAFNRSREVVQDRFNRGVSGPLDVRLASSNVAAAEAVLERRQEQLQRTIRQLETILGRYPAGALKAGKDLPGVPPEIPAGLPSQLLERRPDLVAARHRVFASQTRIFEAQVSLLPRLSLTGSRGLVSEELSDLLSSGASVWNVAGALFQPIFQGGKLWANVDLKRSQSEEVLAAYVDATLRAFREVESALVAERYLGAHEDHLRESAEHATEARALAEDRYAKGLDGILSVLEAQRREYEALSGFLSVRRERLANRIDLHLALGGGYQ